MRTRRLNGVEDITHLGEAQRGGVRWVAVREAIRAIEEGEHFFIEAGSESLLLSVRRDEKGRKRLGVGFEQDAELLLTLPRDGA